jgi:hypothetical protein
LAESDSVISRTKIVSFLWLSFLHSSFLTVLSLAADIKWPELKADGDNAALQPLPARRTGGAGFDMGDEFDDGQEGGDSHSMTEYGNKGDEMMMGSTTALTAGVGAGAYGSSAYHDDPTTNSNYHSQPAVAGYYDPYSGYAASQSQVFYPDQGQEAGDPAALTNAQYDQYQDYQDHSDPYGAARAQAASVSPPMPPYRVGGQHSMHQGY